MRTFLLIQSVHLHKSREARVSCLKPRKTSRDLLQHVSRPDSPTMARERCRAPPRHSHGDPTSLAPTRGSLTSPLYLVRNRTMGPPLENNPEIPPSSRDEGLRLLHGLETNLAASLQTPQEA